MPPTDKPKATVFERPVSMSLEYELRSTPAGVREFEGYAAVFGVDSMPIPFIETCQPGMFKRSIANDAHTFVVDHAEGSIIASTRSTLKLAEDAHGLHVSTPLNEKISAVRDLIAYHEQGETRGMSFQFKPTRGGDKWDGNRRSLSDVKLGHVSICVSETPIYPGTTAHLRSLAQNLEADPDLLAETISDLSEGRSLSPEQLDLLEMVVRSFRPAIETTEIAVATAAERQKVIDAMRSIEARPH